MLSGDDTIYIEAVKEVFYEEIACLENAKLSIDDNLEKFISNIDGCRGTLIWTGIGKSGHICKKIVATMQSLGIRAIFLHPSEALHGDLGIVSAEDCVIIVSNSGETEELINIISPIRNIGAKIYGIFGRHGSTLERRTDCTFILEVKNEAFLDMVPTNSTTATLVLGDAIAVSIAKRRDFTKSDFGKYHPHGQLGKKLTMLVDDIMVKGSENSIVLIGSTVEQVVFEMCKKTVGAVSVVDKSYHIAGLFTDGDLRRFMNNQGDLKNTKIEEVMQRKPIVLQSGQLLYDAICNTISNNTVSVYPVVDKKGSSVGTLRIVDVIKSGLLS